MGTLAAIATRQQQAEPIRVVHNNYRYDPQASYEKLNRIWSPFTSTVESALQNNNAQRGQ